MSRLGLHICSRVRSPACFGLPRSTQDIDLVIESTAEQLRTFIASLPSEEYYADLDAALDAHRHQSIFNVIDMASGWKIDLIFRKPRTFSREEFNRRQSIHLQGVRLFVATAEGVVIAKLEWSKRAHSQRQIEDAAAILKLRWELLDRLYIQKWIAELLLDEAWQDAKHRAGFQNES